jgi:hypothetical protein
MLAAKSPFAQLSAVKFERGLRVDRFLTLGVRWFLGEDSTVPESSVNARILLNTLLFDVRRQAVTLILKISSPYVPALYMHTWTIFLNCALGRRACLHFQSPEKGAMEFSRKLLNPRGQPTIWRLTHWGESKLSIIYVDLEFGLVPELQIRRTFSFPKSETYSRAQLLDARGSLLQGTLRSDIVGGFGPS